MKENKNFNLKKTEMSRQLVLFAKELAVGEPDFHIRMILGNAYQMMKREIDNKRTNEKTDSD